MSLQDFNPLRWSSNLKTIGGLVAIVASIWGAAVPVVSAIYHFAAVQTTILAKIEGVQVQQSEAKAAIVDANTQRDKSLKDLKKEIVPRIEKLETVVSDTKAEAAAAKQRTDDLKEELGDIKSITQQSLNVARSHDEDIKATRRAVAPQSDDVPTR